MSGLYKIKYLQLFVNGNLFHVHCCIHFLNLIVKKTMRVHETSILIIKNAVVTFMSSGNRISEYRKICQRENMSFRILILLILYELYLINIYFLYIFNGKLR